MQMECVETHGVSTQPNHIILYTYVKANIGKRHN